MFEDALLAFKLLESKEILPIPLESCSHNVDSSILTIFGLTVDESKQIISDVGKNNIDALEFKELFELNPEYILKIAQEKFSRAVTIWVKLNRLMQYHNLNCKKYLSIDKELENKSIENFGSKFDFGLTNSLIQISSLGIPLKTVGFSTRTFNALKANNVHYLDDLLKLTETDLRDFRNLGAQSINEINDVLPRYKETGIVKLTDYMDGLSRKTSLENMGFSTRTYNALKRNNINSLDDLLKFSEADLRDIRNLGFNSMKEINSHLD
jgi:DNA-directed RNA polymerase alpha subunit